MNAVVNESRVPSRVAPHPTHTFRLLLRREFWEHKGGLLWAPLVAGGIFLLFTLLGGGAGQVAFQRHGGKTVYIDGTEHRLSEVDWGNLIANASPDDLRHLHDVVNGMTLMSATWPLLVFGFVVFFYLLGSLYDERKDRSVLFWKSLPVSDRATVLSKLATAIVVGPVLAVGLGIVVMLGFGLLASVFIAINGANPFTLYWGQLDPLLITGTLLSWIPMYILWALPTAGWLLLCSAWAKSKPFLWAILLPVFAGLLVTWFDLLRFANLESGWFWKNVVARLLTSAWPGSHLLGVVDNETMDAASRSGLDLADFAGMLSATELLASPSLWIGALAGAAMIAGAIRLRRLRELAD